MDSPKIVASTLAAALLLAGPCAAQSVHQNVVPPVVSPATPGTQKNRCENLGMLAGSAAAARDNHVTENHFIGTLGNRPDAGTRAMLDRIYASNDSAEAWRTKMHDACAKNIK